jgi:hypothetical protein
MRAWGLGVALFGLGVLGVGSAPACGDPKGAIMLAVTTDMKAPKDVSAVSITISSNGAVKHSFIGRVTPQGEVLLPATLAIVEPDDPNATVRIRVMAFQERKPRVLRDVRTSIPRAGRTALLRLPLNFVDDGSTKSAELPAGILPDPIPGTGGPTGGSSGSSGDTTATGDFDFLSAFQPDCPDFENQTFIDGECKDNFVDPETLPDFVPDAIGDSTNTDSCFDTAKCLAGASPIPQQRPGGGGGPTFDPTSCSILLGGADPSKLNVALVTPETGECVSPGECYIPLDRNAPGWKEENGRIGFPSYVCKLLGRKNLRLVATSGTCAAKEEKNPICAAKAEPPKPADLVSSEDFATSVVAKASLDFASASRIGEVSLFDATRTVGTIAGVPPSKLPWRLGPRNWGFPLAVTNGTPTAYMVGSSGATAVTLSGPVIDGVEIGPNEYAFAVQGSGADTGTIVTVVQGNPPSPKPLAFAGIAPTAIASYVDDFIVGEQTGALRRCVRTTLACGTPTDTGGGRIDSIRELTDRTQNAFYALAASGIYKATIVAAENRIQTALVRSGQLGGVTVEGSYYARSIAVNAQCVFYSSPEGVEWANAGGQGGVAVPAGGRTILGVSVGPDLGKAVVSGQAPEAIYYTVFADRAAGGGVYRASLPAQCIGASVAPAADAGIDGGG